MRTLFLVLVMAVANCGFSQLPPPHYYVKDFYDALNKGDSTAMLELLSEDLQVIHYEADTTYSFDLEGFMTICPKFASGKYQEKFQVNQYIYYPGRTMVEVEFEFILDGKHDHCGKDVVVVNDDLKITEIHSYEQNCDIIYTQEREVFEWDADHIHGLLDRWHKAAGKADFDEYFDLMAEDFYYLGTDATERWSKEQFANFCSPHFDKGKAWNFKPYSRNLYISDDGNTIWFDEKLDTWMGKCRGSGVLEYKKLTNGDGQHGDYGRWMLKHYNLTVTIDNDKIQDFIDLNK